MKFNEQVSEPIREFICSPPHRFTDEDDEARHFKIWKEPQHKMFNEIWVYTQSRIIRDMPFLIGRSVSEEVFDNNG